MEKIHKHFLLFSLLSGLTCEKQGALVAKVEFSNQQNKWQIIYRRSLSLKHLTEFKIDI